MRALRDFNIPKIVADDVPVFMGLIGDLFPALDVPRKRDMEFEKSVKQAASDLKLQPEEGFILKVNISFVTFCYIFYFVCAQTGGSIGGVAAGAPFGVYCGRRRCWENSGALILFAVGVSMGFFNAGVANFVKNVCQHEKTTCCQRSQPQSGHKRRAFWSHQSSH